MRVGSRICIAQVVALVLLAIPASAATLPQTFPIDPQGTYFATQYDPPTGLAAYGSPRAPTSILLSTINAAPGVRLRLTSRGRYNYTFWQPALLVGDAIARFVGPSGSVPLVPAPQGGNYSTVAPFESCPDRLWDPFVPTSTYNDPNDFALFQDNPVTIVVPPGATAIEFGTFACLIYDDRNTDNFRVDIDYADSAPTLRNPLEAALKTRNYSSVDPILTLSTATATAMSADGKTAVVVAWVSPLPATEVTFAVSPYGTMSAFKSDYLRNPVSGIGNSVKVGLPEYQDAQGYVYLALLWAPDGLPVAAGNAPAVDLTVSVTQAGVNSPPAKIRLVPPPLLLIHGVWSSAVLAGFAEHSHGFRDWVAPRYPTGAPIASVNYGFKSGIDGVNISAKRYSSDETQSEVKRGFMNLMRDAALGGMAARQVDVVGHSMGGLATRFFLTNPAPSIGLPQDVVHALITIGTPHRGTALATKLMASKNLNPRDLSIAERGFLEAMCGGFSLIHTLPASCSSLTLGNAFALGGKVVDAGAVETFMTINADRDSMPFPAKIYAIAGQAPADLPGLGTISNTEKYLNILIGAYVPETVQSILGSAAHDTIVPLGSQLAIPGGTSPNDIVNGIVHTSLTTIFDTGGPDEGETRSCGVWNLAYKRLTGFPPLDPTCPPPQRMTNAASDPPPVVFDLTGYTEVAASNVQYSPVSGATMTIGVPTNIVATSATKSIRQIMLFQLVVDPADSPLLYVTQAPFSMAFTPKRLGTAKFSAIALFDDMTYAVTGLSYPLQPGGSPVSLSLGDAPDETLAVGMIVHEAAVAGYPNGPIDVSDVATFAARSGTSAVFSVGAGGAITATGVGGDWLDASYLGLTASVQIFVAAPVAAAPPTLVGAVSRRVHGAAGTFDLALSAVTTNPTTEPRFGPVQNVVFTFDKPVTAGNAAVMEGTAIAGTPTFAGNEMTVPLTGVANQQYVTVGVTNVAAADGNTGGAGSIRVGFLGGDVNQNRVVTLSDLGVVNAQVAQQVTNANFLKDVNASGTLSLADKGLTNAQLTKALPAP